MCTPEIVHHVSFILHAENVFLKPLNHIGGVIVNVHTSSVVNPGFMLHSSLNKYYEIGICCFSTKHTSLRTKTKDWLAHNKHVRCIRISIHGLLFQ